MMLLMTLLLILLFNLLVSKPSKEGSDDFFDFGRERSHKVNCRIDNGMEWGKNESKHSTGSECSSSKIVLCQVMM